MKFHSIQQRLTTLLIFVLSLSLSSFAHAEYKLTRGDIAPDYLGKNVAGEEIYVSQNKGKVTVISFWASWCPPCRKEIPVLDQIQTYVGNDRLQVVAVNYKEDRGTFRKLVKAFKTSSVTLTHDKRGSIGKKYGVEGIPHLIIVDKEGKVVYQTKGYGESSFKRIARAITKQLES